MAAFALNTDLPEYPSEVLQAHKLLQIKKAEQSFLDFAQALNPDPNHPDDPRYSRYRIEPHHRLIAEALEKVEKGGCLRLLISMPPQHGKSEEISRLFPAWFMGRNPWRNLMFGTYSQDFANDFGGAVRAIMQHPVYRTIFSDVALRSDSKAKDYMVTKTGGQMAFLGRGGAGTGKPADIFIVDDPIKDDAEAQSAAVRESVWQWFTKVAYTRCHAASAIIIVHTRWHEDDLIGRLTDKENPNYDEDIARDWTVLNLPAVVTDPELAAALGLELTRPEDPRVIRAFGDKPMAALWEGRFSLEHLATAKLLNPRGFEALYMGRPSPEEGDYFKREWFKLYTPDELPDNLRIYAASDHAATDKSYSDPNVIGAIGIDEKDNIYVLTDLVWEKMQTDRVVEEMISLMKRRKPVLWFAESDVIKKSIGPFLRKRMQEEEVYTLIYDMSTAKGDKPFRARSIQGRAAQGKVFLPKFAPWTEKALNELLKFPNGTHDDFVDFLAWIGLGLDSEHSAPVSEDAGSKVPQRGTFGFLKWQTKRREQREQAARAMKGW